MRVWLMQIRDVDVKKVVTPLRRNAPCNALGQIAMRIDECAAPSRGDVLRYQCLQERRFANAGFANDIDVEQAVWLLDGKSTLAITRVRTCDNQVCFGTSHAHNDFASRADALAVQTCV
jgi:hypothetical protein